MLQKTCRFLSILGIFLISATALFAEKTPPDLFLTPAVRDNLFFGTAAQHKSDKAYLEKIKIRYLLEAVRKSPLTFIRNNESYEGLRASAHLLWKYIQSGGRVQTARDFIDDIASGSLQTGNRYLIKDPQGATYPLRDVLYNELGRLEQTLEAKK